MSDTRRLAGTSLADESCAESKADCQSAAGFHPGFHPAPQKPGRGPVAMQPDDTITNQTSMQRTKSTPTVSRWGLLFAAVGTGFAAVPPERAVGEKYCVGCHSSKMKAGGLGRDTVSVENVSQYTDVWEKVVRKLRARYMPPA